VSEEKLARKTVKSAQPKAVSCDKRKEHIKKEAPEEAIPPQSSTTADNVAYRLRSRLVCTSEREAEVDNGQAEAVSLQESVTVSGNTHGKTSPGKNKPAMSHSYNLRGRVEPTPNSGQEE